MSDYSCEPNMPNPPGPKCACGAELNEFEQDNLDCGHAACNFCTYQDRFGITRCCQCQDKRDEVREK